MASTRYHHPVVEIYQDPPPTYDSAPMPTSKRLSASSKPSPPLRALKDASSRRNIIFTPPYSETPGRKLSPLKSSHQRLSSPLSSSPSHRPFSDKFNLIAMIPPQQPALVTDSIEKKMPKFRDVPQKALFTTFMASGPDDKENTQNYYPTNYNNQSDKIQYNNQSTKADFPIDPDYGQKGANKRTLMDAAPIQESTRPFKKPKANSNAPQLPSPDDFPLLHDDGTKPGHSYAQLIGMAILRAPNRRLTLAQIYKWISDTYSFYSPNLAGWQNSIRHNLSLNKAFVKQERPKDDPGKGNYWAIATGTEHQFLKGKHGGKSVAVESAITLAPTPAPSSQPESQTTFKVSKPAMPVPSSSQPVPEPLAPAPDLSSDATIPASDAFIPEEEPEEELEEESNMPPPSATFLASSPPPPMHSSPPVSRHSNGDDTPPPVPPFPTSSAMRSHRRQTASMDDSGYFSALSSSAMRPHKSQKNRFLGSEADREHNRFKNRGRAEEEIARLRGSSYDSPTKSITRPSRSLGFSSQARMDSSPLRQNQKSGNKDSSQMLPPLTPAIKFKAPERPPPSVSPNANLRLHRQSVRELIGSPLRDFTSLDENTPWSPEFNLDTGPYIFNDQGAFDIYTDAESNTDNFNINAIQTNIMNGSPEKRKGRSFQESGRSKSSGALGDVTNTKQNVNIFTGNKSANSTPLLKFTPQLHPGFGDKENAISPSKSLGFMNQLSNSPSKSMFPLSPIKLFASPNPQRNLFSNPMIDLDFPTTPGGTFDMGTEDDWAGPDFLLHDFSATVLPIGDQENLGPSISVSSPFEGGVDLLGGFQRIGSGRNGGSTASTAAITSFGAGLGNGGGGRSGMGRNFASRF